MLFRSDDADLEAELLADDEDGLAGPFDRPALRVEGSGVLPTLRVLAMGISRKRLEQAIRDRLASARLGWNPRLYNPRLERWLHRVKAPALIVWGDSDRIIPPVYGPALAGLVPGARLETIAGCGHLPHVEKRAETLALVAGFLRG